MEDRAALEVEGAILGAVDLGAGHIAWQQVRGELDAVKVAADGLRQAFDRLGFGKAGRAFHQQMPVREEGDQEPFDQFSLTDDLAFKPLPLLSEKFVTVHVRRLFVG